MNNKYIIAHRCNNCDCELWYHKLTNQRNYVYLENKQGYQYLCKECFNLKKAERKQTTLK